MKRLILIITILLFGIQAHAATYTVTPTMTPQQVIDTIQGVNPGDTVLVEPGTYRVRILLYKNGVTLKAADSTNKPIFDYSGQDITTWPGSLTNWHNSYGIEIQADNVTIENIDCKGAKSTGGAAACVMNSPLGFVYEPASPGSQTNNVTLRGMEISYSDDGIGSVGKNFLIEDSEVHHNGNPGGPKARHNIYVHGGSLTIRNSNFHSATQGENVHSRAQTTIIEDSIMGPVYSNYPIGIYTDKADQPKDGSAFTQRIIVKNTTIDARRPDGLNTVKVVAAMNSNAYAGLTQIVELYNNTYLGSNNETESIVQLVRGVGHVGMGLISSGNNWDAFNGPKFLYLMKGQNPNDGFYNINVTDYSDASLPAGVPSSPTTTVPSVPTTTTTTPPPAPSVDAITFNMSWDQADTANLKGWNVWGTTTEGVWGPAQFIPYVEGMTFSYQMDLPQSETYYFKIRPLNTLNQEGIGEETVVTPAPVPLPGPTTNFNVIIVP